jgi:UDP-glucose 4-epimerase
MKRKVLVLGGGGFIGLEIVKILIARGNYEITIADNFCKDQDDNYFYSLINNHNVNVIKADFTNPDSFNKLEKFYDDFYMLASLIGVNNTLEFPHEVIRVNTALIYNTLDWIKKNKIINFLFTSTSECYSGTIDKFKYKIPTAEDVPLCIDPIDHPRFTYAVTKMLGESAFMNYARFYNFNCKIIRYNNIFGPRMGFGHVIPHLVERFLNNETPYRIFGAKQTRSFCYISDGALGTIKAMECEMAKNDIFHIGSEIEITIDELVREVGKYFNYIGEYEIKDTYPGSVSRRCPDITKAKTLLGFEPVVSWKEGLKYTLDWYVKYFENHTEKKYFEGPEKFSNSN